MDLSKTSQLDELIEFIKGKTDSRELKRAIAIYGSGGANRCKISSLKNMLILKYSQFLMFQRDL